MTFLRKSRSVGHWVVIVLITPLLASCSQAPSVDIVGSFFPAWLICLAAAVALTAFIRLGLLRVQMKIAFPILFYPSVAAFCTFALWLIFFY